MKTGLHKHFKGALYTVLFVARDSETEKEMVVYVSLKHGTIWVRPVSMFTELVQWPDGHQAPRFIPVDSAHD
jgi:hypothetical protein